MNKVATVLALCLLAIFIGSTAYSGEYSSDFNLYLAEYGSNQMFGAIITMVDRVDLDALQAELYARRADRRQWHETVVLALQEKATNTQVDILAQLADLKYDGMVESYKALWIGNVILVRALPSALDILVQRYDVLRISPDYQIESIQPVSKGGEEPVLASVENGLRAIKADLVWDMGFTGAGRLVNNLDTGVDGNHPALNARWRGYDPRYSNNPEWAWFDPVTGTTFPFDNNGHGTHTMGTICGLGETTGDTIGVAFDAEWMSAGVIDRVSIPQTVADALLSFQWIVDPDGNPSTVWDVPDVSSNSWGLVTGHGYPPCDPTFWTVLDGCEAAGIVVLFAAGNEGFSGLRRPADRATTDITSFAIGALDGNDPNYPIAGFSSRGPTYCTPNGDPAIKPEVSAPGVNVRSSVPGGGYAGNWSGTSMATPHVAGVVALMRQANPNLSTQQVRQILLDTADDLGPLGNDNDYGMGIVDAYEAVQMALAYLDGWGTFAGTITDLASGSPLDGAVISVLNRPWSATSNSAGNYTLFVPADTLWDLRIEYPPTHLPVFDQQMAIENDTLILNYALEGKVTVTLMASFGNPIDVSYRAFYLKGSWDNDGFYDPSWSGDLMQVNDDGVPPDQTAEDGIFTGEVMLARDTVNTYSWAIYSEDYGGEDARLDDGAGFQIPDLNPPTVPTLVVNPSGSENNWIISAEGDHGLSLDLIRGLDNNPFVWADSIHLFQDTIYTFRFYVMHSTIASYGSGGIGGPDLTFSPDVDGFYDFIFDDSDDSYIVQLTGTEGPPTYLSCQSGLDGHIPVGWLPPGTVESVELAYDDGVLANGYYYYAYDALMATMFVPAGYPVSIDSVMVHVLTEGDQWWPWPDPTHDPVGISVFLDDGSGYPENTPVFYTEVVCDLGQWIRIDVDEILVSSGNFWVAMNNLAGGDEDGLGLDANTDYPANKWSRTGGVWGLESSFNGDHMIRARVFGGTSVASWIGYDSSPAVELNSSVPINIKPALTDGSSIANRIISAVETKINIGRTAYFPAVSVPGIPVINDVQVLAGYNLYRDTLTAPFDRNLQINTDLIIDTNYDDWGADQYGPISNGVLYYYQASAVYDIGGGQFVEVGPSNEATGMAQNHPPANPTNLVGSSLGNTVTLDWAPNTDYDIDQYRIFRRDYDTNDFVLVGTVIHPDTTFSEVIGVDGIYRYKIAAVDAEGMQSIGYSNSVDIAIGAIPPRDLTATTDLEFRIDLDWRHPGIDIDMNVMVVASDGASQFVSELAGFDDIDTVIYFDARNGTPTMQDLDGISIVVVWSNYQFLDPVGMGNVLADYVDLGGSVLIQQFSFGSGWELQGRLMSEYSPFSPGDISYSTKSLGNYNPNHQIMDSVTAITDYFASDVSIVNNGVWVAYYDDDTPFVAYNPAENVVAINGYIGDSRQFTGDMITMVHNAMNYAAAGFEVIPDNYKVYRGDNPSGPFFFQAELPGDVTEYTDAPVPNGVEYYYYVTAVYPGPDESDPSNVAIGAGMNYPPDPPYDLVASVDIRDINMDWSFDDLMGDFDHFKIYKKLLPGGIFELAGTTFDTTYVITIPEGEDGVYAVVATAVDDGNPQLESEYSNQVFVAVGNLPPFNLRATSNQEDVVPLAWSEPGLRPTVTLAYDDGMLANGYYYFAYENIMANRFVASTPVEVETLWVHVLTEGDPYWPWPDPAHDPVGISVWDDNGSGMPGTMAYYIETTCQLGEWIMLPIDGGLTLNGPNFWVGMQNLAGGGEDGMGLDAVTDYPQHKWARESGNWNQQNIWEGDHMIRATIIDNTSGAAVTLTESRPTIDLAFKAKKQGKTRFADAAPTGSAPAMSSFNPIGDIPVPLDVEIILGYNVYRSETPNVPVDSLHRINDAYITELTYDDSSVVNGTTYYYVATAMYDNNGNIEESPPSNEVEATPRMGARMVLDPTSFEVFGQQGEIVTDLLNIANPGGLDLDFSISTITDNIAVNPGGEIPGWTFGTLFTSYSEESDKSNQASQQTFLPVILDSGGPDAWGYFWIDSDEPGGPAYDWIDIVGIGQPLYMSDDDNQGPFPLLFSFPFYDLTFNSFRVCSNGWISFTSNDWEYWNYPLLNPESPENFVGPFWDDLNPSMGGEIWYYTDDSVAVVSWINVPHYGSGGPYTFQVILRSDGTITFNYENIGYPNNSATIGIQNSTRTIALQVAYNQSYVHNNLAVLIKGWLTANPGSGTVAPGGNFNVVVSFDATVLDGGIHTGSLIVTGYDLNHMVDQITVPVTFHVATTGVEDNAAGLPRDFALHQNYPNPFNPNTDVKFDLPVDCRVRLEIFNILGQKVVTVIDEDMKAGYGSVTWNGNDRSGRQVSSGVYFYKLTAGDHIFTKKMMMLK
ncbi:MAG: S8 family serine peptidase [Candidatus Zixiibacteriota bacterium]|nr:MAG: S8 family serine peptidase [candidate division Zixibacteria bacterium]